MTHPIGAPFSWFGGKGKYHLDFILPLLPQQCTTFVDVFGGSGAVLLNRQPVPLEVLNDVDRDLVNFFRVLREDPEPLLQAIRLTPYAREEHRVACTREEVSDVERARRFFIRAVQSIHGKAHECRPSSWSYTTGQGKTVRHRTRVWRGYPDRLARVADRLLDIQIECRPALDLIPRWDHEDVVFYLDPPYVHTTRKSTKDYDVHEMTDDDHRDLADVLGRISGRAAVSGYASDLYDSLYEGWHRHDAPLKIAPTSLEPRQEVLWTNYEPEQQAPMLPFTVSPAVPSLT